MSVLARPEADSGALPSLELGRGDVMAMRRACLFFSSDDLASRWQTLSVAFAASCMTWKWSTVCAAFGKAS